jgi:hypothetical protein
MRILPLGYYNQTEKTGHASAVLLVVRESDVIVAVADTGETAVSTPYKMSGDSKYEECAVVLVGKTDLARAETIIALISRYKTKPMAHRSDLIAARAEVMRLCDNMPITKHVPFDMQIDPSPFGWHVRSELAPWSAMGPGDSLVAEAAFASFEKIQKQHRTSFTTEVLDGWRYNFNEMTRTSSGSAVERIRRGKCESATQDDACLAVRKLTAARGMLVSHPQQGPSCTFYCVLWLLGLCEALAGDSTVLDRIVSVENGDHYSCDAQPVLLECVCRVERALKQAALVHLVKGADDRIADLVARAYGKCMWLAIPELREALGTRAVPAHGNDKVLTSFVRTTSDYVTRPREPAATMTDLAAWIAKYGYVFASSDTGITRADVERHASVLVAFLSVARGLLALPRATDATVAPRLEYRELLVIAEFLTYLLARLSSYTGTFKTYYKDTLTGMLMRCVRYTASLVAARVPGKGRRLVPPAISVTIPWVAAEYYALIEETKGLAHLVLSPETTDALAALPVLPVLPAIPVLPPSSDARIMAAQAYHAKMAIRLADLLAKTVDRAERGALAERSKRMKDVELTGPHLSALAYINSDPQLAAFNLVVAHLNRALQAERPCDPSITGGPPYYYAFGVRPPEGPRGACVVFHISRSAELARIALVTNDYFAMPIMPQRLPTAEGSMRLNMDYMYWYTRACAGKPVRLSVPPGLVLTITSPLDSMYNDVPALVEWADYIGSAERDYGNAGELFALMHMHLIPPSAAGSTHAHALALIAKLADRTGLTEEERRFVRLLKRTEREGDADVMTGALYDVVHARVMLAHATNTVHEIIGGVGITGTIPSTTWAVTDIAAAASTSTGIATYTDARGVFVVDVKGQGLLSRLRLRLEGAGCRFDHWQIAPAPFSYSVVASGATIDVDPSQRAVARIGDRSYALFVGAYGEWWDETHGAAVFPLSDDAAATVPSGLLVIPGRATIRNVRREFAPLVRTHVDGTAVAYLDNILAASGAFFVSLDSTGMLLDLNTATREELVCVFAAYAFGCSIVGTRLMPSVVSRAIHDETPVVFPGVARTTVGAAIRHLVAGAPCPYARYSALALLYHDRHEYAELASRMRPAPNAPSFWVDYGERDWNAELARARAKGGRHAPAAEITKPCDEWTMALETSTGRFVSRAQRAKVDQIMEAGWGIVQMGMGFGKSSVVVPLLVAKFLELPETRVVFVTQPTHLVAPAARAVGALIATHPYVGGTLAFAMNKSDFTTAFRGIKDLRGLACKLVVVLSTADMQCIVRDNPRIYADRACVVHIADEVDTESDPLRSEVIIEGTRRQPHYKSGVDARDYYALAFHLGSLSPSEADVAERSRLLLALDGTDEKGVKAGTRLRAVFEAVRSHMVYRVDYGLSDDPRKRIAVPYVYAGSPSPTLNFSDADVASAATALATRLARRESYAGLIEAYVTGKFGGHARAIIDALRANPDAERRYYLTHMALPTISTSEEETVVSFVDLLAFGRFIGFSGTMGTSLRAAAFSAEDPRVWCAERPVPVAPDEMENSHVLQLITEAECIHVPRESAESGVISAQRAIEEIKKRKATLDGSRFVCIVDGCGAFGAFDDDVAVMRANFDNLGYFDAAGVLVRVAGSRCRYYRHRDSRGVDSEMEDGTVGFVTVDVDRSDRVSIAQSMMRLRQTRDGTHTVIFVVLASRKKIEHTDAEPGSVEVCKADLYQRLCENERRYTEAGAALMERQLEHAAKRKATSADFVRRVVYGNLLTGAETMALSHAASVSVAVAVSASESQTRVQTQSRIAAGHACYHDKWDQHSHYQARRRGRPTLRNEESGSDIGHKLRDLNIGISPLLSAPNADGARRAFAVDGDVVVVSTIVEAWAGYTSSPQGTSYTYYAHDGYVIRKGARDPRHDSAAIVLLGRFLCDDQLGIDEEIALLYYLKKRQTPRRPKFLVDVLDCMWDSGFLTRSKVVVLRLLCVENERTKKTHTLDDIIEMPSLDMAKLMLEDPFMQDIAAGIIDAAKARQKAPLSLSSSYV